MVDTLSNKELQTGQGAAGPLVGTRQASDAAVDSQDLPSEEGHGSAGAKAEADNLFCLTEALSLMH